MDSKSHDVYDYIDKLIYQKYSNEIVDTIKPGMSVELANGYRYDVICNKAGQLEIVKHFHKNHIVISTPMMEAGTDLDFERIRRGCF